MARLSLEDIGSERNRTHVEIERRHQNIESSTHPTLNGRVGKKADRIENKESV